MTIYRCDECGHLFEEGEELQYTESWGEHVKACPLCRGTYSEATECLICGSYEKEPTEEYCERCVKDVSKRFKRIMESEFSEAERNLLNELYDGEEF